MKEKVLAENHNVPTINAKKINVVFGENVEDQRLPVGYKIIKNSILLEVTRYIETKSNPPKTYMMAYCSGCGTVTPALKKHTKVNLETWFENHIALFRESH